MGVVTRRSLSRHSVRLSAPGVVCRSLNPKSTPVLLMVRCDGCLPSANSFCLLKSVVALLCLMKVRGQAPNSLWWPLYLPAARLIRSRHSQDGPVGHADLALEVYQRFCHRSLVAEGVGRADPRTQRHPQALKWRAHGYAELPPAGLALKETLPVALLLATDPEDL